MIDWIEYRWKLSQKMRQLSNVHKEYDEERNVLLGKDNAPTEVSKLAIQEESEVRILHDEISMLQTRYYCAVASRRSIPLPSEGEANWDICWLGSARVLTATGLHSLRSAIRREWKEGLDTWAPIASLLVAIVALFVAGASLLANIHNHACQ